MEESSTLSDDNRGSAFSFSQTIFSCRAPYLSLLNWRGSVQSQVGVAMIVEEDLQNVQHPCHLGEDECPGREKSAL